MVFSLLGSIVTVVPAVTTGGVGTCGSSLPLGLSCLQDESKRKDSAIPALSHFIEVISFMQLIG